jgi:protein TonB
MARDLFNEINSLQRAPTRSAWTIAGSVLAHAVLVAVVLVLPVLSALDHYVVQARPVAFLVPPAPVMPAMPAAPPSQSAVAAVPDINPNAAPTSPAREPVTTELPPPGTGRPVPDGWIPGVGGSGSVPGVLSSTTQTPLAPPPPRKDPIRPGGDVKPPTRVTYVDPIYPRIAVAAKVEGYVILEATIDETGVVRDAKVLRSVPLLDQSAIDAVMKWRYTPTRLNGQPVPILLTVTVVFTLR